jgi:hypothetical protein
MTEQEQHSDDKLSLPKARSHITLDINISRELCHRIHIAASQNNLSLNEYVERILGEAVSREASLTQQEYRPITRKTLEHILQVRKEIMEHTGGHLFEDSTELIRQEREERTRYLMELHGGDDTNVEN